MKFQVPQGMTRRHFMSHMAGASALTLPALSMGHTLQLNAQDLTKRRKSAILLWMSGGPSTMDIWDLKPGAPTGGPFKPISTSGDVQISEHMPLMAKQMHNMAIIRSMSTREADHGRGRYYMHTGYVPNPNVEHPSYGAVLSHELIDQRAELEIPPFITVGGGSIGPGFLGMAWAPFTVNSNGQVRNLEMGLEDDRLAQRMRALDLIEKGFISQRRGTAADDHQKILKKTLDLMTANHLPGGVDLTQMSQSLFSEANNAGTGFGLGFAVVTDPARTLMPASRGEYYWGGAYSTAFFVDPVERITMVFMTQLYPSSTYPIRRQLKTLIYSALTHSNA